MMWVNDTLPPRERIRWLLMTTRLSMSSLAGTARTLVAVGTSREDSMLVTTRALAPRRGGTTDSPLALVALGASGSRGRRTTELAGAAAVGAAGGGAAGAGGGLAAAGVRSAGITGAVSSSGLLAVALSEWASGVSAASAWVSTRAGGAALRGAAPFVAGAAPVPLDSGV